MLDADETPTSWYNIQADLPKPLPPPLDPTTLKPIDPKLLERIFAKELIRQEVSTERYIKRLVTETGAGQWGTALAFACTVFGLKCRIYMVRVSYQQKPGRRTIAQLYGAEMFPSPSDQTNFGRKLLKENPNHPGTLGIAISEAIEDTVTHEDTRYSLGSVLNHVLLHQTIIVGSQKTVRNYRRVPGCCLRMHRRRLQLCRFLLPFMMDKLKGKTDMEFVACESKAVPHTTKGVYTYDFGDTAETTPLLKMLTIGHGYACPPIHAGGLRYHGMAPSISYLITKGYMRSVAYHQTEVFQAAQILAQAEGLIIAPETAHSLKFAIDEALRCRKTGERKVIAMNYSGHGLLDIGAYEQFLAGKLTDYEPEKIEVPTFVSKR